MWFISALAPIVIVGGIVVFVMKRMERQYKEETLGKKKLKEAQNLLDIFIPIGMLVGCVIGLIFGMFSPDFSLLSISLGWNRLFIWFLPINFIARQETTSHNPKE